MPGARKRSNATASTQLPELPLPGSYSPGGHQTFAVLWSKLLRWPCHDDFKDDVESKVCVLIIVKSRRCTNTHNGSLWTFPACVLKIS